MVGNSDEPNNQTVIDVAGETQAERILVDRTSGDAEDSSLEPAVTAAPARAKVTGPLDSGGKEEHVREAPVKVIVPAVESMRRQEAPTRTHAATAAEPTGSLATYLSWAVIAFSTVAIVASFAIR
jgi:hypothetical protein